jgi:hypothetical protein
MRLQARLHKLEIKRVRRPTNHVELLLQGENETIEEAHKRSEVEFPNAHKVIIINFISPMRLEA